MMTLIINAALARARTVIASLILLLVAGTLAYIGIPKESDPDINIPIIYVSVTLEGISPQDSERLLLRPLEQELRTIEGVKEMRSNAFQGGGNVIMEFDAGFDADVAMDDVREKVDLVRPDLPQEVDEPTVNEINFSLFPVIVVALGGDVPERTLLRLARDLQDDIEGIPSVLQATIAGDREELVEIIIDPVLLESYSIEPSAVAALFARSNRLVAAGNVDTGEGRFAIKVPGLFETVDDVWNMPIKVDGDAVVRVRDVARLNRTFKDPESFARVNGKPAVALEVSKRSGENIIDTIEEVKALVRAEQAYWPEAIEVTFSQDRSEDIRIMLSDLQNNVLSAILLVMIVCVAALGLRSALLVGIAIPGAFLTGILVIAGMGLTVNIVVLFALILAVGMLVDGAIVVTEYADRRMTEGAGPFTAYGEAAKVMAWPIIASTATTLAAFMPLLFWPGVVGEFMKYLPITLIATLAASLMMALVFVPALGVTMMNVTNWIGAGLRGKNAAANRHARAHRAEIDAEEHGDIHEVRGFTRAYLAVLERAIRHPALVLIASVAMLFGVVETYKLIGRGVEFFPEVEPEIAMVLVQARGNLSIHEQNDLVGEVERRILGDPADGLDPVDGLAVVYTRVGTTEGGQDGQDIPEDTIGQIMLEFADWDERRPADEILGLITDRTADIGGIRVQTRKMEGGPPTGKDVQLELTSRFAELLNPMAARLREGFEEEIDDLVAIEDSRPLPGIEWRIEVDRAQAAKYDLDVSAVGEAVKLVTNGIVVGTYRPDDSDDEIDIAIRYPPSYRAIDQLDHIRAPSSLGVVPLSNFVERIADPRISTINRLDGQRLVTVKADVVPGVLVDDKVKEVREWLATLDLDPRVSIRFAGADEEQQESAEFLGNAFGAALFIMAIILITQFNSFYSAFLILSAVIMSTIGVMIGLIVTDQPFGVVMTGVGVIALAGIVVNNNIVLIDTYDRLAEELGDVREAILRTGVQRLRPVMLTTITTILGLMPMVLRMNIDFVTRAVSVGAPSTQWWASLSTAIVFGLAFATILTLVVTPSALMLRENLRTFFARRGAPVPLHEPAPLHEPGPSAESSEFPPAQPAPVWAAAAGGDIAPAPDWERYLDAADAVADDGVPQSNDEPVDEEAARAGGFPAAAAE